MSENKTDRRIDRIESTQNLVKGPDGFPCYCKCHVTMTIRRQSCEHCNSYERYPPPSTEQPASTAGSEERVTVELIDGKAGRCIGINDYRICGEKPIHGVVVTSWKTTKNDVLRAFLTPDQKHDWLAKDLTVTPVEPQQPPAPAAQETGEWRLTEMHG